MRSLWKLCIVDWLNSNGESKCLGKKTMIILETINLLLKSVLVLDFLLDSFQ